VHFSAVPTVVTGDPWMSKNSGTSGC